MRTLYRNLMFAALVSIPLAVPASAGCGRDGCGDDFPGPGLDADWTFLDKDGKAGGSAQVAGGKLTLAGRGSDVYLDVNEFVGVTHAAAAGNFDVSVKIESQSDTHPWAQAGILAANDVNDLSKGGYVVVDVTPANAYNAFYDSSGTVGTLDSHVNAGVSGYPVWIRLARKGKKFSAWYKNQIHGQWVVIAQNFTTQGTGSHSQLALVSLSHNDNVEAKTVFDDFTCEKGPAPKPPKPHRDASLESGASPADFDASGRYHAPAP